MGKNGHLADSSHPTDDAGVVVAGDELGVVQQLGEERQVLSSDPTISNAGDRGPGPRQRLGAVGAVARRAWPSASRRTASPWCPAAYPESTRTPSPVGSTQVVIAPGPGRKRFGSSALIRNSIAWPRGASAAGSKPGRQAGRDPQLLLDQVDAVDELGDRVLDLQPGVHLQEEELAGGRVEQALDGARVAVADRLAGPDRPRPAAGARSSASTAGDGDSSTSFWLRRCTEHSRSPSATHGAVGQAEDLHLDVAYPREVALDQHRAVAEHPLGERAHLVVLGAQGGLVVGDGHAHAAAAGGGLDHHRVADRRRPPRARRRRRRPGRWCRARPARRPRPSGCVR